MIPLEVVAATLPNSLIAGRLFNNRDGVCAVGHLWRLLGVTTDSMICNLYNEWANANIRTGSLSIWINSSDHPFSVFGLSHKDVRSLVAVNDGATAKTRVEAVRTELLRLAAAKREQPGLAQIEDDAPVETTQEGAQVLRALYIPNALKIKVAGREP